MGELFSELNILDRWWNNGVITLEDYLKKNYEDGDDLPF